MKLMIHCSVAGTVGSAVSGLTGDRAGQAKAQEQHDAGKSLQRGVELDLQKQAGAMDKSKQ